MSILLIYNLKLMFRIFNRRWFANLKPESVRISQMAEKIDIMNKTMH